MKQLTPNVYYEDRYSLHDTYRGSNRGFVVTDEGVVMIDAPLFPTDAVVWRNELRAFGDVEYLLNTHAHFDHVAGTFFFPGTMVAHEHTAALLNAPLQELSTNAKNNDAVTDETTIGEYLQLFLADLDPDGVPLLEGYEFRTPDVSFSEDLTLSVGEHTFEVIHTPGHTYGDVGVYVPEEDVYFAGDVVTTVEFPNLSVGPTLDWVESLQRIESLDPAHVLGGHGPIGDVESVRSFREFLEACIEQVAEGIERGQSLDEIVETTSFEDLRPSLHPGEVRHRQNVTNIYEHLTEA